MEKIGSASYNSTTSASDPGDTFEFNTYSKYTYEYKNPADTFIWPVLP